MLLASIAITLNNDNNNNNNSNSNNNTNNTTLAVLYWLGRLTCVLIQSIELIHLVKHFNDDMSPLRQS